MSPEKSSQESGDPRDDIGPETMLGAEHILVRMFIFAIFFLCAAISESYPFKSYFHAGTLKMRLNTGN